MKHLFGSFAIAFSMYSRIPMPKTEWTENRMKYALCFFPLVGAAVGLSSAAVISVLRQWGFPAFAVAAAVVMPLVVTGGIHMDGFLDVMDAKSSHGEKARKLEIMKDPHTGAFAIIYGGIYLLLYAGCVGELRPSMVPAYGGIFVLSRALSGLSVVNFPKAKKDGLVAVFSSQAERRTVTPVMILFILGAVCYLYFLGGAAAAVVSAVVSAVVFTYYRWMCMGEFGGTTGDLAGYFLQILELCLVGGLAVVSHLAS